MNVRTHVDVLISGNGPGALATAWEAMRQGKSILMVANREDDYVRVQRVFLDRTTREYLIGMLTADSIIDQVEEKFLHELTHKVTIAIKDIERYIKRRLDELNEKNGLINFIYNAMIDSIDSGNGIATIGETQIKYRFLIGADGVSHHAANLFNQSTESNKIIYESIASPAHPYHGSFYVLIEREDGDALKLPEEGHQIGIKTVVHEMQSADYLCYLSLDMMSFSKSDEKSVKCNFVSELPEALYQLIRSHDEKSETEALIFAKKIIEAFFEEHKIENDELKISIVKKSTKHGSQKDNIKLVAFETELVQANTAAIREGETVFLLVGDAFRKPNYQLGHGVNDALLHARSTEDIFKREEIDSIDRANMDVELQYHTRRCVYHSEQWIQMTAALSANKNQFIEGLKIKMPNMIKDIKEKPYLSYLCPLVLFDAKRATKLIIPIELNEKLGKDKVYAYILGAHTTLDQLIELQNTKPWIIKALGHHNIYIGIVNRHIDIDQLCQLTKEQVAEITKHGAYNRSLQRYPYIYDDPGELASAVDRLIIANRKTL